MWLVYSIAVIWLSAYSFMIVSLAVVAWGSYRLGTAEEISVIGVFGFCFQFFALYYLAIRPHKSALRHGIILTDKSLRIFGDEVPLSRILRTQIVDFGGTSGVFLAVAYLVAKKGRRKIDFRLLRPSETENIYELRDKIRELKGWPKQSHIHMCRFWDWRRTLKKIEKRMVTGRVESTRNVSWEETKK